jgi:HEAT repeat protein
MGRRAANEVRRDARRMAALALGCLGSEAALLALEPARADRDHTVRRLAEAALIRRPE